jgi:hypothetical protein
VREAASCIHICPSIPFDADKRPLQPCSRISLCVGESIGTKERDRYGESKHIVFIRILHPTLLILGLCVMFERNIREKIHCYYCALAYADLGIDT